MNQRVIKSLAFCIIFVYKNENSSVLPQNQEDSNGYPRGFVNRTIKRQIKKRTGVKLPKEDEKAEKMVNASIPFIEGLSQEVRRIAQAAGVKCTFRPTKTLRSVYSAKDRLPKDTQTHCTYSLKCGTCEDEYVGAQSNWSASKRAQGCSLNRWPQKISTSWARPILWRAARNQLEESERRR